MPNGDDSGGGVLGAGQEFLGAIGHAMSNLTKVGAQAHLEDHRRQGEAMTSAIEHLAESGQLDVATKDSAFRKSLTKRFPEDYVKSLETYSLIQRNSPEAKLKAQMLDQVGKGGGIGSASPEALDLIFNKGKGMARLQQQEPLVQQRTATSAEQQRKLQAEEGLVPSRQAGIEARTRKTEADTSLVPDRRAQIQAQTEAANARTLATKSKASADPMTAIESDQSKGWSEVEKSLLPKSKGGASVPAESKAGDVDARNASLVRRLSKLVNDKQITADQARQAVAAHSRILVRVGTETHLLTPDAADRVRQQAVASGTQYQELSDSSSLDSALESGAPASETDAATGAQLIEKYGRKR